VEEVRKLIKLCVEGESTWNRWWLLQAALVVKERKPAGRRESMRCQPTATKIVLIIAVSALSARLKLVGSMRLERGHELTSVMPIKGSCGKA